MRNKRVYRQGGFSAGGPSNSSGQTQSTSHNQRRQGNTPYNRSQDNQGPTRSVNTGTRGNQSEGKLTCHRCGQEGHYVNDCKSPRTVCYNCQRPGHFARDCKAPRAESSADVAQGARPAARGGAYCMGTRVSGQTGKAIQRDCQIAGNTYCIDFVEATHSHMSWCAFC